MGAALTSLKKNRKKPGPVRQYIDGWEVASEQDLKIVVCGSGGVGKSAFSIQFVSNHFVEDYDPTIEDSYRKQVQVNDKVSMLEILDTAGQEEFAAMRDQWFRSGDGFILMYSVTDRVSFDEVKEKILLSKDSNKGPMVLVGNKCDCDTVDTDEGTKLAAEMGVPFLEASAKLRINVEESFEQLVIYCRRHVVCK